MNWRSVEDDLPPLGYYIVFNGAIVGCSEYYPDHIDERGLFKGWKQINHVTHWMYFPEGPNDQTNLATNSTKASYKM